MPLRYDPDIRCYIGERVAVPADEFDEALKELLAGGGDEAEARTLLLDEEQWIDDEPDPLVCRRCGQPVLPGMRYCDARCAQGA